MAYCRFSSNNFKCDIYAYQSINGYVIHVATKRRVGEFPHLPDIDDSDFLDKYRVYFKELDKMEMEELNLPYDGQTFTFDNIIDFWNHLIHLKEVGYYFPNYVFDDILNEITETTDQALEILKRVFLPENASIN